ncbi:uncharacterized protein [Rutidosis leptorrhynchoides]|uniref:uncharacterized protein n=1 Tax=Rutidosis leptorrhynchoides TaxID=125765 RepID=UPI003A99E6A1
MLTWDGSRCIATWCWTRNPSGRAVTELEQLNLLISGVSMDNSSSDSWKWVKENNGKYTTKSLSKLINTNTFGAGNTALETIKNNLVPKKVVVFIWKARRRRIPVREELDKRGVDLHSVLCPLCDDVIESVDHTLLECKKVIEVWKKVLNWCGFSSAPLSNLDNLLLGMSGLPLLDSGKHIWQGIIWVACYLIWKNRNHVIFKNKGWTAPCALSEIQVKSFEWIVKRFKGKSIDWHSWFHNPSSFLL